MNDCGREKTCGYYSSDEDVAWGPLTLREIKREFSKPKERDFHKHLKNFQELQTSGSIASSNTDYYTANETVESQKKKTYEMDNIDSRLNLNEFVVLSNKSISPTNQFSEKKECLDADEVICVYSDGDDENFEHFRIKSEVTNSSNIDIISLSSDDEMPTSDEKLEEMDADIENSFDDNKVCNKSILENGISRSSICALNITTNTSFENNTSIKVYATGGITPDNCTKKHCSRYKISESSGPSNVNKNSEHYLTGITANDLIKTQPVICEKSKSSLSPTNENNRYPDYIVEDITPEDFVEKHFPRIEMLATSSNENSENTEFEFDNYEAAINANSTINRKRNQLAEIVTSPTFSENKSLFLDTCYNTKHNSLSHEYKSSSNSSNNVENISICESIESLAAVDSSEPEKSTNFQVEFNNEVASEISTKLENSEVPNNISSIEVGNKQIHELNSNDEFGHSNSDCSYRSQVDDNEDENALNDTLTVIEKLIKSRLEINNTSDEFIQASPKYSVEADRSICHIEEPISRIPIFLSTSIESKHRGIPSLENFKMPSNPKNGKKCLNVDRKLTPIKKSPNVFKDIISPVRMYIKNSTLPVLKQTHKPIMVENDLGVIPETSFFQPIKHRNLVKSFPEVIYKPSKKVIEKFDSEIILPDNIRKLVKERIVIKHEIRTRVNLNESQVSTSEKLQRADLSFVMSDERNMSLHTAKQGFNI